MKKTDGMAGMGLTPSGGNTPTGLGNVSTPSTISPMGTKTPMSVVDPGGGASPQGSMPSLGTKNQATVGASPNPLPQKSGGLGGVGKV
jgi:hypothetical protein